MNLKALEFLDLKGNRHITEYIKKYKSLIQVNMAS